MVLLTHFSVNINALCHTERHARNQRRKLMKTGQKQKKFNTVKKGNIMTVNSSEETIMEVNHICFRDETLAINDNQ